MQDQSKPTTIAITGANGQIGYILCGLISQGKMLGLDRRVNLNLIELPQILPKLEGLVEEINVKIYLLKDCYGNVVSDFVITSDPLVGFKNADIIILVGAIPRKEGMERKDLIQINTKVFQSQGKAIDEVASPDAKVKKI